MNVVVRGEIYSYINKNIEREELVFVFEKAKNVVGKMLKILLRGFYMVVPIIE